MANQFTSPLGWGLLPLFILAVVVTITLQFGGIEIEDERSKPPDHSDYYIRGAKMSKLGPNGKLLYQVQAEEILHFRDRSAQMTNLSLHYQGGGAGIWFLKAGKGRIPADGETVELVGDVVIKGKRPERGLIQMHMSEVEVIPEQGLMRTDKPVSILEPDSRISAIGMEADILSDVITLSKNVQVRYAW